MGWVSLVVGMTFHGCPTNWSKGLGVGLRWTEGN